MSVKNTYLTPKNTENPDNFPSFSQPKIIGSFSLDGNRTFIHDPRNCKYLYNRLSTKSVNLNLNNGMENVIRKPENAQEEKIDHLLRFVLEKKLLVNGNSLPVDFVCFRGLLRLLMCTPYEYRDSWIILATKFRRTIYLCAEETEKHKQERLNATEKTKQICSYGFKFEQYMLSDDPIQKPTTTVPVNESEEFCCMFKTTLNGQRLLYGAEMDGIESDTTFDLNTKDLNECQFVELKVKLREQHERQRQNYYRYKLRNWWCQCFLAKIDKIIVGTRKENGVVTELSDVYVRDIPRQVKNYWSPAICMEFLSQFLQLVAKEMEAIDCAQTVYRFEFDPSRSPNVFMKTFEGKNELSFLPDWYIREFDLNGE